ncbi:MAG: hypothetical protein BM485_15215 [Desulfobulbaceae bacterium DB1]|nr:MAG: hypothetical protein BM485_15215 [Desulfobulbaceae bacterium DB1]
MMNAATMQIATESHDNRSRIKERTLAVFDFAIPFHIIAMDTDGLVFRYVGNEQWFRNPKNIDIVHDGFIVKNLRVSSVSDFRIPSDLVQTRHHRVQFTDLSPEQMQQLDHFIVH